MMARQATRDLTACQEEDHLLSDHGWLRGTELWDVKPWIRGDDCHHQYVALTRHMGDPHFSKVCITPLRFIKDPRWYVLSLTERKPKMIFRFHETVITTLMEVFPKSRVACGVRRTFGEQGTLLALGHFRS